ncbi:protein FAM216A isoform X2 [Clupea harengus]|uniref:Protein FAM216A isoform X2 n=1 Tax=Clupea harengus TaxID=7950 RepID=A0A6P8FKV5_CLUHA|nr:protein FAM216A isoform X2 [Clupea harengus]
MRKQVTFMEESRNRDLIQHGNSRYIATRSAGSPRAPRVHLNVDEHNDQNTRTLKTLQFKPLPQQTAEDQHMKTIHIPKSMVMAPFLKHPSLTPGQKRYLYSIASVYSTDHMRRQMRQHYLNILRSCTATAAGHRSGGKRGGTAVKAHVKGLPTSSDGSGKGPPSLTRTNTHQENSTANSGKLVLPQITRHDRNSSHISAPNVKGHSKMKSSNIRMSQCASSKEMHSLPA